MSQLYFIDACLLSNAQKLKRGTRAHAFPGLAARFDRLRSAQGLFLATITLFELRRGMRQAELENPTQGLRKRAELERILLRADIFPLDSPEAWEIATDLWARGRVQVPPVVFPELEDLLAVATARRFDAVLLTTDAKLHDRLDRLGAGAFVECVPLE